MNRIHELKDPSFWDRVSRTADAVKDLPESYKAASRNERGPSDSGSSSGPSFVQVKTSAS